MITHLDLFSGIGGFSLAADWVWGADNVKHIFCEIEEFPQKVLMKHWPGSEIHHDITKLDGRQFPDVFLLTGGFPCQPYSVAGKQRGKEDDRALWPEMLRVISEAKPRWIIGENVGGFVNMGLDDCLSDLEGAGYDCQPLVIPACAVDANHRRDRCWILAHSGHWGGWDKRPVESRRDSQGERTTNTGQTLRPSCEQKNVANPQSRGEQVNLAGGCKTRGLSGGSWWAVEPDVGRVANGISGRVDRLKGLGNAIVPQVAAVIMQDIKDIETQ